MDDVVVGSDGASVSSACATVCMTTSDRGRRGPLIHIRG
jgi:hypothetical protein